MEEILRLRERVEEDAMKRIEATRIAIIETTRIAEIIIAREVIAGVVVESIDMISVAMETAAIVGESIMIAVGEKKTIIITTTDITKATGTDIVAGAEVVVQDRGKRIRMQLLRRPADAADGILVAREKATNVGVVEVVR